ncbi:MAG TPA: ATP-binding cassette domain-containing protein [Candidatus Acidoferrales bacterium]|nr:ATP-binding cassette domain-containing protein [Candidatus Acidoferrales bacterium]
MDALLTVESLTVRYRGRHGGARMGLTALDGVSFEVRAGTTLGVAGASGAGKSTLALCLACLERPTLGKIVLDGRELTALDEGRLREVRPQVQLVFQDPAGSLDPQMTALEIVREPFDVQKKPAPAERTARAIALLERVGLGATAAGRTAGEFSGGQKQRLAIARALAAEPRVLILDEPLSALDASVGAQIANLLAELQGAAGLSYVFITHDLAMAAHLADEMIVLDGGRIVERGLPEQLLLRPAHAATRALVAATPRWQAPGQGGAGA